MICGHEDNNHVAINLYLGFGSLSFFESQYCVVCFIDSFPSENINKCGKD